MAFGSSLAGILGGAGGGSFVGGAVVRLLLDAAQFDKGLSTSEARLHRASRTMSTVGGAMTRSITLPVVAAGAAAVKMAVDFETSFTRIRANSNLTSEEIDKLRGHVLDLAGKTAKSPKELADALYFLASAGLDANQVQETLTMSAKASAAGFGEVDQIAKLTATALNAYAKDGLTAAQVTDTLAAAIREGTAEPDEFASALGRILPAAQKAGVGFDEVLASLSSLSNVGLDVNEGVTAMRGLMLALTAPSSGAAKALKEMGLSADEVRRVLAEDGLLAVMRLLEERTGGNIDKMKEILPNVRALSGLFGITSQEAGKVSDSFDSVSNSTGDLDKAFKETKKGSAFQMQRMLAEIKVLAIELGTQAIPVLKDVVKVVTDGVKGFRDLPDAVQGNIIKFALLAAAIGPILSIGGKLITVATTLGGALIKLGGIVVAGGPLAIGLALAATLLGALALESAISKREIRGLADALLSGEKTVQEMNEALADFKDGAGAAGVAGLAYNEIADKLTEATEMAKDELRAQLEELDMLPGALDKSTRKSIEAQIAQGHFTTALTMMTEAEARAREALEKRGRQMEKAWHETERLMNITNRYQEMLKTKKEKEEEAAEAVKQHDDKVARLGEEMARLIGLQDKFGGRAKSAFEKALRAADTFAEKLRAIRELSNLPVNVAFTAPKGDGFGMVGGGKAVEWANAAIAAVPGPQSITSTFRPGSITASGNRSYHGDANNPAADIGGTNLQSVFNFLSRFPVRELIYGNAIIKNGVRGAWTRNDHWDHVHVADQGGVFVNRSNSMGLVAIGPRVTEPVTFHGAQKIGDAPGQGLTVNVDLRGAVITDEIQFDDIITKSVTRAMARRSG